MNIITYEDKKNKGIPEAKDAPITPAEKTVRAELDKLNKSIEDLRKLREELEQEIRNDNS
jgi:hypothetical protein